MKINCKSCGKRFDHEKHGGTCPKCGTVQTAEQHTTSTTNKRNAKDEPRKKSNPVVTAVLVVAMVLTAIIPIVACHFINQINADKYSMESFPQTIIYELNKAIPCENDNYTITITDAIIETNEKLAPPKGYEFVAISYHIIDKENPDITYVPYEVSSGAQPYLVTRSGCYLRPLASYSLRNTLGLEYEEAKELGISDSFSEINGTIYFLVKEKDAAALRINLHHTDSSNYDAIKTLERIVEIQDLEVNR